MSDYKPSSKYGSLFFNAIHTSVLPVLKQETMAIAEKIRKDVIRRIRRQIGLQGAPLSKKYIRRKIAYGLDFRTLIATEQYIRSIIVEETEYGARVGVKNIDHEGEPLSKSRVPMHQLAEWLEYGTTRPKIGRGGPAVGERWYMPPRPHWRPAQAKFARELGQTRKKLTSAMENALMGALLGELGEETPLVPVKRARFEHKDQSTFQRKKDMSEENESSGLMSRYKTYVSEGSSGDEEQD